MGGWVGRDPVFSFPVAVSPLMLAAQVQVGAGATALGVSGTSGTPAVLSAGMGELLLLFPLASHWARLFWLFTLSRCWCSQQLVAPTVSPTAACPHLQVHHLRVAGIPADTLGGSTAWEEQREVYDRLTTISPRTQDTTCKAREAGAGVGVDPAAPPPQAAWRPPPPRGCLAQGSTS